jgi:hypothetical protein
MVDNNTSSIERRLHKLESSNRLLKAALAVCVLVGAAAITLGATSVAPKVLDVQKIIMRDEAGNERGQLFATDKTWGLVLFNKKGTKAASLFVAQEGNGLIVSDQNGNIRQALTADLSQSNFSIFHPGSDSAQFELTDNAQGTAEVIRDRANVQRVELGTSDKGSALALSDNNGTMRTVLSGSEEGIVTFAPDGSLKWSPTWDKFSPQEKEQLKGLLPKSPTAKP